MPWSRCDLDSGVKTSRALVHGPASDSPAASHPAFDCRPATAHRAQHPAAAQLDQPVVEAPQAEEPQQAEAPQQGKAPQQAEAPQPVETPQQAAQQQQAEAQQQGASEASPRKRSGSTSRLVWAVPSRRHPLTFLDEWARQEQDGQQRPPPPQPPQPPSQLSPPSALARSHSSSSRASLQPSPLRRARPHAAPVRATAEPSSPPEGGAPPRPSTAPPLTPPVSTPVAPCSPEHATSTCSGVYPSTCGHHALRSRAGAGAVGREAEAAAVLTAMIRRRCRLEAEVRTLPKKTSTRQPPIPHLGHPRPCTRAHTHP